ncbi:hypothetical protein [Pedobacter cryoconitis]|uniref:Uncharacterized protein n=2 Tax=Pedobacter TaxID=84567 RepID=A0A327SH46_9SPHI|nr:hypothetical protein [Pedobacter cryoconitis]RAJ27274.1 hypothetical protein LY11_03565 [Pedobacter cryoconitis]
MKTVRISSATCTPVPLNSGKQAFIASFARKEQIMEASELRIGNYTMDHGHPEQIPYGSDIDSAGLMDPILLTEEWVVKFGFERFEFEYEEGNETTYVLEKKNGHQFVLNESLQPMDGEIAMLDYKLQYVHQIQNLYFALTNEELMIKE